VSLLKDKVAIVTGAGRGIGRAHALELAKHGARVVVNDIGSNVRGEGRGTDAEDTVKLIATRGGTAIADFCDVSDHDQAQHLIDVAVSTWGRVDVLVNNAGIVRDAAVWNLEPHDFDAVVKVHLRGTWSCSHHAAVYWRRRAKAGESVVGRVINTTSGAGLTGNFGQTAYAAAKAGIVGLTLTLAQELAPYGVTANAIGPAAATRLTGTMPSAPAVLEADDIPESEWHPMDPANSSPMVAWLASDGSQLVNGQVFRVIRDKIIWMRGWTEFAEISSGETRWQAASIGPLLASDAFRINTPGMRFLPT
jgi:NAD(P)-dependent dehydrogenase (short-subunit alcohol dehydrogenase family)